MIYGEIKILCYSLLSYHNLDCLVPARGCHAVVKYPADIVLRLHFVTPSPETYTAHLPPPNPVFCVVLFTSPYLYTVFEVQYVHIIICGSRFV